MITGISDRAVFAKIRSEGHHVRTSDLRIRFLPQAESNPNSPAPQLAYAISRKVGNAVTRNRIRRRLRVLFANAVREHPEAVSAATVVVLPGAAHRSFAELEEQVVMLMKKIEKSMDSIT